MSAWSWMRSRSVRRAPKINSARVKARRMTSSLRCSLTYWRSRDWPHHQVATEGGCLHAPAAEGVGEGHIPAPFGIDQSGHAEKRVGAELERIAKRVIGAA